MSTEPTTTTTTKTVTFEVCGTSRGSTYPSIVRTSETMDEAMETLKWLMKTTWTNSWTWEVKRVSRVTTITVDSLGTLYTLKDPAQV